MYDEYLQQILESTQQFLIYINHLLGTTGCILLADAFLLLLVILKLRTPKAKQSVRIKNTIRAVTNQHIDSIAGDDVMTTQLDLARAYIEMDEKTLAMQILEQVAQDGNPAQQRQAQQLMTGL